LAQVLLYGDVMHVSSSSLIHVRWHERVATVGDFYTEDAMQDLSDHSIITPQTSYDNMGCMIEHIHLGNNTFSIPFL
jgi:hypothetical protein